MMRFVLVGLGGCLGSMARYALSEVTQRWMQDAFPRGTLAVNILGCLIAGVFWSLVENGEWFSPQTRVFVSMGILGGFTTFSAFGYETFALFHDREYLLAFANVGANVVLGIGAVIIGWMAGKALAV